LKKSAELYNKTGDGRFCLIEDYGTAIANKYMSESPTCLKNSSSEVIYCDFSAQDNFYETKEN